MIIEGILITNKKSHEIHQIKNNLHTIGNKRQI